MPVVSRALSRPRARALSAAAALSVIACGTLFTASPAFAAPGQSASCPAGTQAPGIGNDPLFTDTGVAVYAGGTFSAKGGAAESEGLMVTGGGASFASGYFNLGVVGAGSGIVPPAKGLMLASGGDVTVGSGSTVEVGHPDGGGVDVAGAVSGTLETDGGTLKQHDANALAPFSGLSSAIGSLAGSLSSETTTGTTTVSGDSVTFTSTSSASQQVFDITVSQLSGVQAVTFESLPVGSSVVVDVTGSGSAVFSPNYIAVGANRADNAAEQGTTTLFGTTASRVLWNFPAATVVTLGGSSQIVGSILAPKASVDVTASLNGRLYVGGDITMHGIGNEIHNYPWIGGKGLGCSQTDTPSTPGTSTPPAETPTTNDGSTPTGDSTTPAARQSDTPDASSTAPLTAPYATPAASAGLAKTGSDAVPALIVAAGVVLLGGAGVAGASIVRRRRRA
ncbi:choice-of-anchor A family protein [Humibacter ginsenosidimutans]|uniref:Choice-of-anchor A family protein n=1 Tax=Humibacter ginsenosidimutans TaxID=2599293 RepID=A0A5B8M439_9MICO|nr:choice-of-anchor A family protein [Humibacter ginsenosidimutans]QDZ14951.1 choice-of-anchor A family protein [Humibacter ginsenosidimutans]